jgi:predicted neutral ceramidase superfamily lipid hydrolase
MSSIFYAFVSLLSLAVCLLAPVLFFLGKFTEENYKLVFFLASIAWFIFATLWARKRKKA